MTTPKKEAQTIIQNSNNHERAFPGMFHALKINWGISLNFL